MPDDPIENRSTVSESGYQTDEASLTQGVRHLLSHFLRLGIPHVPRAIPELAAEDLLQLGETYGVQLQGAGGPGNDSDQTRTASNADTSAINGKAPATSSLQERRKQAGAAIAKGAYGTPSSEASSPSREPVPGRASVSDAAGPRRVSSRKEVLVVQPGEFSLPVLGAHERTEALGRYEQEVAGCSACPALAMSRKHTVFGEGSVNPRFCFFGEAPGAEEDRSGRPFVGPAGQLLTKMIEACTLRREDVYILNTIKCRPPGNRNPELEEVAQCRHFFEQQFEILQPEYIVCLGAVASRALLMTTLQVGQLRGVFHQYKRSKVLVTYHPSYLLRQPDAKRAAWEDLQMLMRDAGVELPSTKKPRTTG